MGWIAIYRDGRIEREDEPGIGRPVEAGNTGGLIAVGQKDFGHTVLVDLINGVFYLDWEDPWYCYQTKLADIPIAELPENERLAFLAENPGAVSKNKEVSCNDPHEGLRVQNGTVEIHNIKYSFVICEGDTNIVGEYKNLDQSFDPWFNCFEDDGDEGSTNSLELCANGHPRKQLIHPDGTPVTVRTDILTPLLWRAVWFTRNTNGVPTKVIGAQTTTPPEMGGRNIQKVVSLFADGRVGID